MTTAPVVPGNLSRMQMAPGMRSLVVAIDPGHGGQDSGAVGPTGKLEKNVTLAIGRELARQINATPGMKAYMTRDSDVFIPLPMRAQRARAAKADIFISIHADAADNRAATGSSVYVLSTRVLPHSVRVGWRIRKTPPIWSVGYVCTRPSQRWLTCYWIWRRVVI